MDKARLLELATEHVALAMLAMFTIVMLAAGLLAFALHRAGWLHPGWCSPVDPTRESYGFFDTTP